MIVKEISNLGKSRYLAWIRLYVIALILWLTMFLENVVVFFFLLHLSKRFFFLAALLSMQALSSPNWGRTHAPCSRYAES